MSEIPREIEVTAKWGTLLNPAHSDLELETPIAGVDVHLIKDVFSAEECPILLNEAEKFGFGTTNYPKHYRGNLRLTVTDQSLSEAVWERLVHVVPPFVEEEGRRFMAAGLNPRWRLAKYVPGDVFKSHVDAFFEDDSQGIGRGLKSMYTVNIYMNENFEGGNTAFAFRPEQSPDVTKYEVVPKTGLCLLFRQPPAEHYSHEGKLVESGYKYLFRSDVMYYPCK
eukprot:GDKK01008422.1.p1 GENE.GDKK01008422.1~~GDKK01008422.1.p1  ORF type:complete len:224 (+),score=45.43 GDKK01008422.1:64-735(+)